MSFFVSIALTPPTDVENVSSGTSENRIAFSLFKTAVVLDDGFIFM